MKKLAKTLVRAIRKNNEKIRVAQPTKVGDVGTPFRGKGNRLGDEPLRVITTQFDKKAAAADNFKRRAARNNQLAITA